MWLSKVLVSYFYKVAIKCVLGVLLIAQWALARAMAHTHLIVNPGNKGMASWPAWQVRSPVHGAPKRLARPA